MATHTLLTAEQFDQLPEDEGRRYELLDGELIELASATPEHNLIEVRLGALLNDYFQSVRMKAVALPDTEFALGENRRLRPDISVLLPEKWESIDRNKAPVQTSPDIAAEIVSPSETATELDRKVRAYLEAGTAEVWVVYPDGQHLYLHTLEGARRLTAKDRLDCPLLPDWSIAVSDLFALL